MTSPVANATRGKSQAQKTRRLPKTTAIPVTGSCGHEFKDRYPLPQNLTGAPLSSSNSLHFESWKRQVAVGLSTARCPECQASGGLDVMRHKLLECSRWLDVPVPPPIDAPSVRSAWFAEEVRFSIISSRMSAAIDTYQEAFDRSTASRLLIDALSQRWPDESWVDYDDPKSGSPAGRELLSELPDLLKPQPWRVTQYGPQGSLAIWLFGREAWPSSGHPAFTEVNYQRWIAMRRTKRLHADMALHATTPGGLSLSGNVLACQIVTGLNHWESPADAWTAYVALQSGSVSDILSGAIGSHSGLSLTEMLHMGSVMSAVSEMGSVSPQMRYGQYPL